MCEALAKRLWQKALSGCLWYSDLYTVSDGRCDCCFSKRRFVDCSRPTELVGRARQEHREGKVNCHATAAINYTGD